MAKRNTKRNKGKIHKAASLKELSPEMLMERGNLLLEQEKYQDAIACFKQLLKLEQRVEFLRGLEQAYLGRIAALAAKSMHKEAMALLDTLVQRCPDARVDPHRLNLHLQSGNYTAAVRLYGQCHTQLAPQQRLQLEALFGALLLAENGVSPVDFEADSPIIRTYPKALAAIDTFCTGQADKVEEALRQIPIRSPYRDLRILLNGLHHFSTDKVKAYEFLRKIAKDSPYYHTATGYLANAESPKSLLTDLANTSKANRSRLQRVHGLTVNHLRVLEELARSGDDPILLYQIVNRNERWFDKGELIQLYRNIIPFCGAQAVDILEPSRVFSIPEKCRLCALAAEKDDMHSFAISYWGDYLHTIDKEDPKMHRQMALVIRRQATLMKKGLYVYPPQEILDTMMQSLEYNPRHVQTWLDASEYARQHNSLKQYYAIIRDAVQNLPEEVPILLEAMRASGNRGAHKKAAGLAERVLALDPINTAALDFLVTSRLEHGRKLASQKKWALAEKQLLAADTRTRSVRLKGRSRICLGMLLLLQNNDSGLQHLDAGRQENPYPLLGHVLVALEARLYDLPQAMQKKFDRLLKQHSDAYKAIDQQEFQLLITWAMDFKDGHWRQIQDISQALNDYFSKAATMDLSLNEGLALCRVLERINQVMALVKCSAALKKRYPDTLEFKVWHLLAMAWKKNRPLTAAAENKMEDLLEELVYQQQHDFVEEIDYILENRELESCSYFDEDDMDEEDFFIDFGPFGAPKTMPDPQK